MVAQLTSSSQLDWLELINLELEARGRLYKRWDAWRRKTGRSNVDSSCNLSAESERSRTLNSKEAGQQLDDCGQPVKAC
jgi:hypothetical protein